MIGEICFFEFVDVLFLFFGFVELVEGFVFEDIEAEVDRFEDFVSECAEFLHGFLCELILLSIDLSGVFGDVFGVVADAFDIGDGECHLGDFVSLVAGHVEGANFDEPLSDGVREEVDGIFIVFDFLSEFEVLFKEAPDGEFEIFASEPAHAGDFTLSLLKCDGRRQIAFLHVDEFAVLSLASFFREYGDDFLREFDEDWCEWAEQEDGDDRENGVRISDLSADIVRGE